MSNPSLHIAGYDGSPAARGAVALAVALAAVTDADVMAVTAYRTTPRALAGGPAAMASGDSAGSGAEQAEQVLSGLEVDGIDDRRIVPGSAAHVLTTLAEREGASLLAVGATHRGRAGRLLPGSVGERLVHGAPCPVVVVPAGSSSAIATIAVAYDEGPESRHALHQAEILAQRIGARIVLVNVIEPVYVGAGWAAPGVYAFADGDFREQEQRRLTEITGDARVLCGAAGPAIATLCTSGIDLLLCGSRAYGPVRTALAGSVSRYLLDHAPCPVMIVPRGSAAELGTAAGATLAGVAPA